MAPGEMEHIRCPKLLEGADGPISIADEEASA